MTLMEKHMLLTPAQVSGAKVNPEVSVPPASTTYDWHLQTLKNGVPDGPGGPNEGTPTGSSGDNHLEDWNDK
jgi:hypothetical protein